MCFACSVFSQAVREELMAGMNEIKLEHRGACAWVTLNRPERLNAMNGSMMDQLSQVLADLAADPEVRCVVLTGAGTSFSAGGDLAESRGRQEATRSAESMGAVLQEQVGVLQRRGESSYQLLTMPKPTIAVMRGHVVGGAVALALACDLRIASQGCRMTMGFARVGLSGDFGMAYLLQLLVGGAKARELSLLDPRLSADEAHSLGLLTTVTSEDALESEAQQLVERLARGPTFAYGKIKENLYQAAPRDLRDYLVQEAINTRLTALSADSAEAGRAFSDKREPVFRGW